MLPSTGATGIEKKEDEKLLRMWKKSDLWPATAEAASSVFKANDKLSFIAQFCPEVVFERFGYFSSFLSRYSDEIDSDAAHRKLSRENIPPNDPRWYWEDSKAQHYSECPLYAVLEHRSAKGADKEEAPWWREHLAEIIVGVFVALATVLLTKIFG